MGKYERRLLYLLDELSHRECLTGTCDAFQCLCPVTIEIAFIELLDGFPLIPGEIRYRKALRSNHRSLRQASHLWL